MNETIGIFVKELKNRFLCEVMIDGVAQECYIASSCHLSNFVNLIGKEVILRPITTKNARTKYAVRAFIMNKHEIPLEIAISNRVIENELHRRLFSFLGPRRIVVREYVLDGYKCDLFIKDSNTLIEIKSVLTTEKHGKFPTVYSERAVRQLKLIRCLLIRGYKVSYFFVSLNPLLSSIEINDSAVEFKKLFIECTGLGMNYYGFVMNTQNGESSIKKTIPIKLNY